MIQLLRDLGTGRRLPQVFSAVLGKTMFYFLLNVLQAAPTHGKRLEEGVQTGFLIATRELGGTGIGTGEGTAEACCSLVVFMALEQAR